MPLRLSTYEADFEAKFTALLAQKREVSEDVDQAVRAIIAKCVREVTPLLSNSRQGSTGRDTSRLPLRIGADEIELARRFVLIGSANPMCAAIPPPKNVCSAR